MNFCFGPGFFLVIKGCENIYFQLILYFSETTKERFKKSKVYYPILALYGIDTGLVLMLCL